MPIVVPLAQLGEGAVLAADVLDGRENVLLAKGTRLTTAHIQLIVRRGVAAVTVATPEELAAGADPAPPPDSAAVAAALERHERVFARVGDDPVMQAIRRASRAYLERGNLPPS